MPALTEEQLDALVQRLEGTSDLVEAGLSAIGLVSDDYDVSEIEAQLAGANLERCGACDWWFDSGELAEDGDAFLCPECVPAKLVP